MAPHHVKPHSSQPPYEVHFLTLPDFTLLAVSAAVEVLRMANRSMGREFYRWSVSSTHPQEQGASCGLLLTEPGTVHRSPTQADLVLVCGGLNAERWVNEELKGSLRDLARRHVALGALCTGTLALARAGVLDGYRATVHWENINAVREQFPKIKLSSELFVIDRDRYTCGGGVAPLDMMLSLVREHLGPDIAGQITEVFSLDRIRPENHPQHVHLRAKVGLTHEHLMEAAALMAANVEEPLPMDEVARLVGVSRRQIERLFKRYVGVAPTKYYLDLRLQKARELLQQTSMSIMEISIACGFVSNPHFSHCYRKLFGHAPSVERLEQQFGKDWAKSPAGLAFAPANLVQFSSPPYQGNDEKLSWSRFESKHPPLYQWQQSFWLRQTQSQTERLGA